MAKTDEEYSGKVLRFSGADETKYEGWKFWTNAYIRKLLAAEKSEEYIVSELVTMILPDTPAFEAIRQVDENELYGEGGITVFWATLDARFPVKRQLDKKGEVLDEVFSMRPTSGETGSNFTGRVRTMFAKASALRLRGLMEDEELKGYLTLRSSRLSPDHQALVLSLSQSSWEINDIVTAIRTAFPGKLPTTGGSKTLFFADDVAKEKDMTLSDVLHSSEKPSVGTTDRLEHLESDDDDGVATLIADARVVNAVTLLLALENDEMESEEESKVVS